ncbi:MAG: TetR/AcrR family transcriptional regulator [Ilumatobacteraceae bacterium]
MSTPTQRDEILLAALGILRRDGAAALTVRNIAAAAGCSTTGVYTYFGGKDGLVDAIFADGFERFDAAIDAAAAGAGDPMARLHATGEAYRAWALANPTQYQVMFTRAVPDFYASEAALARALRSFEALVARVAAAAESGGIVDDDPVEMALHLWATVHGYVMLELMQMQPPPAPSGPDAYTAGLTRLIRGLTTPIS